MEDTKIKILGERNTGTNYLYKLIQKNFECELLNGFIPEWIVALLSRKEFIVDLYFKLTYNSNLGWKHAVSPEYDFLKNYPCKNILFITLTKNPYSWLLSLHKRPYHNEKKKALKFDEFLDSSWKTVSREMSKRIFENPVKLWNRKNRSYLKLKEDSESLDCECMNLKYEDLIREPKGFLKRLEEKYNLKRACADFKNYNNSTKDDEGKSFSYYRDYYLNRKWMEKLNQRCLNIINKSLDKDLMRSFRYDVIESI